MDSCKGKQRYDTYREADKRAWFEMSRTRAVKGQAALTLVAYKCPTCQAFHIGTRSDRQRVLPGRTASEVS